MSTATDLPPVQIIQQHLESFNAQDLDVFCALCAEDVRVEDSEGRVLLQGEHELRAWYAEHFAEQPELKADLLDRISIGEWVIDENVVTGYSDGSQGHVVIMFRVSNGHISLMRILR